MSFFYIYNIWYVGFEKKETTEGIIDFHLDIPLYFLSNGCERHQAVFEWREKSPTHQLKRLIHLRSMLEGTSWFDVCL